MRIAVINLTGGGMSGGYRKYLRNIIPRMAANPAVDTMLCASPASLAVHDWFEPLPNVEFANCKPFRLTGLSSDQELKHRLKRYSPDVIFLPVERFFKFGKAPIVNMVRNMEPFAAGVDGNPMTERIRQQLQHMECRRAVKMADRIIVPSRFVADFLMSRWNISSEKIGLVYYGVNTGNNEDSCRPHAIPGDWSNGFIFTAGSIRPARGLEDILQAVNYLASHGMGGVKLLIAGSNRSPGAGRYHRQLKDWIEKNSLSENICWTGSLSEKEMKWCYQNCRVFVMTSRVESFGMIAGEAIAHGCICISADNPCLPEIFGDAAIYYQPRNWKALTESIKSTLGWDVGKRRESSMRARRQASRFSWDVCAEKTLAHLAKAAGGQEY